MEGFFNQPTQHQRGDEVANPSSHLNPATMKEIQTEMAQYR